MKKTIPLFVKIISLILLFVPLFVPLFTISYDITIFPGSTVSGYEEKEIEGNVIEADFTGISMEAPVWNNATQNFDTEKPDQDVQEVLNGVNMIIIILMLSPVIFNILGLLFLALGMGKLSAAFGFLALLATILIVGIIFAFQQLFLSALDEAFGNEPEYQKEGDTVTFESWEDVDPTNGVISGLESNLAGEEKLGIFSMSAEIGLGAYALILSFILLFISFFLKTDPNKSF